MSSSQDLASLGGPSAIDHAVGLLCVNEDWSSLENQGPEGTSFTHMHFRICQSHLIVPASKKNVNNAAALREAPRGEGEAISFVRAAGCPHASALHSSNCTNYSSMVTKEDMRKRIAVAMLYDLRAPTRTGSEGTDDPALLLDAAQVSEWVRTHVRPLPNADIVPFDDGRDISESVAHGDEVSDLMGAVTTPQPRLDPSVSRLLHMLREHPGVYRIADSSWERPLATGDSRPYQLFTFKGCKSLHIKPGAVDSRDNDSASTSEDTGASTSENAGASTSENVGVSTSENLGASTSEDVGTGTSENVGARTSENVGVSTSEHLDASTSEDVGAGTSENVGASTSENVGGSTSENVGTSTSENDVTCCLAHDPPHDRDVEYAGLSWLGLLEKVAEHILDSERENLGNLETINKNPKRLAQTRMAVSDWIDNQETRVTIEGLEHVSWAAHGIEDIEDLDLPDTPAEAQPDPDDSHDAEGDVQ